MTLCLYECLKAAGLQRHYARFTSVGVHRAAHLSGLTMEDYPFLGIRSMEDRTRLFNLVQMLKTVDLESLEYEDLDDYESDGADEGYVVVDSSITNDACGDPDEDVSDDEDEKDAALNADSFSKPSCVRRRLDFSCEAIDHHQKLFSHPVGSESYNRHNEPGQGRGSAIPVQHDNDSAVVCGCKGSNNHKLEVHGHQSNHHIGANGKQDIMEELSINDSHTRFSTRFALSHKLKPRAATAASRKFSDQPVGRKDRKEISRKELSPNIASEHTAKATPVYESKRAAGYNYGLPLSSPLAQNKKQRGAQRISVCVRKRPLTCTERRTGEADVVTTLSGECVVVHESKEAVDLTEYILQHRFYFDQVFGEESSNEEVYRRTAYPLVQHMLNGGRATCFAYGQTGAGKTHTMLGSSPGRPGLYALAVRDIFAHLSTTHTRSPSLVYVSFFEIYCGQLYDLLDHRKRLFAREDGQKVVHIAGLRDVRVDSVSSLLEVISQGTEERTQGMSGVNPHSSRSHALLQIQLRSLNQQIAGRMWFVDLAGSERASDTKEPDRQSRMEGAEINQSLLALKECIRSLDQEQSHTPFRQSKLTQVLKDSFIGDSMTCMIANISPGHLATEHTLNTLRYADRVKELRGQGGLRGGRRGKTIPSPKRNLSNSNSSSGGSSTGTRGKSPPKKPKLGRQREVFGPSTPPSRVATGGSILCSTPKNSRWGEETSARGRKEIGLEQITPIRGMLGTAEKREKREKACGRVGRRETYGGPDRAGHANGDQMRAGLVLGQATDEQHHLWEAQQESVFYRREKANQPSTLQGEREGERRSIERRTQVESSRDTYSEVKRQRERDLQKVDGRDKERERHLRQYHQQLQQFMPSSASSAFSSSNQASLSSSVSPSSCSPLRHSSHTSVSALMLEEALDVRRARAEVRTDDREQKLLSFPGAEICLQTKTSPSYNKNKGHGDLSKAWRVSLEGTGSGFGQERGKREKRRSLKAAGEGVVRERRPAGVGGGGERRWAWVVTTETERTGRRTGAKTADLEALRSYNCDSEVGEEGLDASNVSADGVWSTEEREGANSYSLVSTHSRNGSNSLFNHPSVDSPHRRAPAERPLSPACEHANTLLTPDKLRDLSFKLKHTRCTSNALPLPWQNAQQGVPSSSCRQTEPLFAANANRRELSNAQSTVLPLTTPTTWSECKLTYDPLKIIPENPAHTQVHNHVEAKAKTSLSALGGTSADSLSYTMDPLSMSLLQVDQQVAMASFLQGDQNNACPLESEWGKNKGKEEEEECLTCVKIAGKVVEDEDIELHLSLLELPRANTHCPPAPDTVTAANHSDQRKDMSFTTYEHCGIGMMKPPIDEVMLGSLLDQEYNQKPQTTPPTDVLNNKDLKSSSCASVETPLMQSISSPLQHSQNLMTNGATQMPPEYAHKVHNKLAFPISTPQSLQANVPTESNSEKKTSNLLIRPIVHPSTLEDVYHSQWDVVQAHWEQLEEMETLCRKDGRLLGQQPDMAFGEYVHKLGEIMDRKARCVHSMIAQLQPYLKTNYSNQPHNQGEDKDDQITSIS